MGGHGGLNILPQKSWNVYGQRNRQKVAEDEAAEREKREKEREQQTRGDRVARVNVLRKQIPAQELDEPDDTVTPSQPSEQLRHINFWSDHEAATRRNPEAEAEKADQLRKRGDPKTQTSDARFDARFAVLHGHTGQAPWYARRSATIYAEVAANIDHSRSAELASVRTLLDKSQQPRLGPPQSSRRGRGHTAQRGSHKQAPDSSRHQHVPRSTDGSAAPPVQPHRPGDAATAPSAPGTSTHDVQPARAGTGHSRSRSRSPNHRRSHHAKHKHDKKSKKHKHRSRDRSRERSRSCSPQPRKVRSSSKTRHDTSRRRHRSPSGSGSSDRGGSRVEAARRTKGAGKPADGFEALRRERLERERLEAARARQLMREHFNRS